MLIYCFNYCILTGCKDYYSLFQPELKWHYYWFYTLLILYLYRRPRHLQFANKCICQKNYESTRMSYNIFCFKMPDTFTLKLKKNTGINNVISKDAIT